MNSLSPLVFFPLSLSFHFFHPQYLSVHKKHSVLGSACLCDGRLSKIGKICNFSPCIEQISKTVTALNEQGFVDIQMFECLIHLNEVRILPLRTIDGTLEMEQAAEKKRRRGAPKFLCEQRRGHTQTNDTVDDKECETSTDSIGTSNKRRHIEAESSPTRIGKDGGNQLLGTETPPSPMNPKTTQASTPSPLIFNQAEPRESIDAKNVGHSLARRAARSNVLSLVCHTSSNSP